MYSVRNIDKLKRSSTAEKEIQQLKSLFTEREKVMKSIHLFESSKENIDFTLKEVYKMVNSINSKTINHLKKSLKELQAKMKEIIKNCKVLNQQFKLIQSVLGVGLQTAIYFLISTKEFNAFDSARKFSCYAGVAPFEYSSGPSIKGRTKVNYLADKKIKSLLQMCAMTAIKYDPQLKEYYHKNKEEGTNKILVLNNIRCKIIGRIFAVINRQTP